MTRIRVSPTRSARYSKQPHYVPADLLTRQWLGDVAESVVEGSAEEVTEQVTEQVAEFVDEDGDEDEEDDFAEPGVDDGVEDSDEEITGQVTEQVTEAVEEEQHENIDVAESVVAANVEKVTEQATKPIITDAEKKKVLSCQYNSPVKTLIR